MEMFNGMFGKVANGMCRLSMNGGIAVKTSNGYKTYNLKTNKLTNCNNFVFNVGEEFFFVIPTNHVKPGDIIIASGKPKCVISTAKDTIKVINYEDSVVQDILPERHVFMGNTYFYGRIVSMFGSDIGTGKNGMNKLMSYMLLSQMMGEQRGGDRVTSTSFGPSMSAMLPFMMMGNGGFSNMFDGLFDFDFDSDDDTVDTEEDKEEK